MTPAPNTKEVGFRCDACGRFRALKDFERGLAYRYLLTPDSETTAERYVTLCYGCRRREEQP